LGAGWGANRVTDLLDPLQLHRVGPAVALVHHIVQAVERLLITGRRNIQAPPRSQFQARCAEMKLDAVFVGMSDPKHVILRRVTPEEVRRCKKERPGLQGPLLMVRKAGSMGLRIEEIGCYRQPVEPWSRQGRAPCAAQTPYLCKSLF